MTIHTPYDEVISNLEALAETHVAFMMPSDMPQDSYCEAGKVHTSAEFCVDLAVAKSSLEIVNRALTDAVKQQNLAVDTLSEGLFQMALNHEGKAEHALLSLMDAQPIVLSREESAPINKSNRSVINDTDLFTLRKYCHLGYNFLLPNDSETLLRFAGTIINSEDMLQFIADIEESEELTFKFLDQAIGSDDDKLLELMKEDYDNAQFLFIALMDAKPIGSDHLVDAVETL